MRRLVATELTAKRRASDLPGQLALIHDALPVVDPPAQDDLGHIVRSGVARTAASVQGAGDNVTRVADVVAWTLRDLVKERPTSAGGAFCTIAQ